MPNVLHSRNLFNFFKFDYVKCLQIARRSISSETFSQVGIIEDFGSDSDGSQQNSSKLKSLYIEKATSIDLSHDDEDENVVPSRIDGIISIDGSQGEGGGQIVRNAVSYANILRIPIHIHNIRAGRQKPGLKIQHQMSIRLATKICGGKLIGHKRNATEVLYQPTELENVSDYNETRSIFADVRSAGSICLLLQAALPCALFGPTKVCLHLKGGTNATMAPQYDYWKHIFLPTLIMRCSLQMDQIESTVIRRGFYPDGKGYVQVNIRPIEGCLRPITLKYRGKLNRIMIYAYYSGLFNSKYAHRMTNQAILHLQSRIPNVVFEKKIEHFKDCQGNGAGLVLVATFDCGRVMAGSAVAKNKKDKAFTIGAAAAEELYRTYYDGGCVDEWLQDQLIIYAALADGVSEIMTGSLTRHTQTAISIAEQIVGVKFEVLRLDHLGNPTTADVFAPDNFGKGGRIAGKHLIRCHGVGFQRTDHLQLPNDFNSEQLPKVT